MNFKFLKLPSSVLEFALSERGKRCIVPLWFIFCLISAFFSKIIVALMIAITFLWLGVHLTPSNKIWLYTMKIIAWFFKDVSAIELIDFEGDVYYSLAFKNSTGELQSYVQPFFGIGMLRLRENGKFCKDNYIKYWIPLNKLERFTHLLTYDMEPAFELKRKKAKKCQKKSST